MKKCLKYFVPCILLILIITNAFIIISGLKLSDEIYRFEFQTKNIKKQNSELEKKLYDASSLQYAASQAAQLGYTKNAPAYSLTVLKRARNR
ncbi:hypothetical protein AUK04_00270 [Candidatus Roizmanbacteria bacterium CG2_30_33_16]|uniref:Uncharacterized protein n=5 Tax=Candidatus Roizmaniibacteriota TaxID=1752723 RepID=A0A2M7E4M8_9BACT|nr:hypothetical protein [Candidatus Roizmanbacteria bacterium]OIP86629.1 MAG: hypothetical protein AUK04_00270 [Candidatus Roizmanbacteria bacterium CG2_30_33_16]PIP64546.1 MAG: hypothetical protein COW96_01905 [Candidatus Roizmanbacteria bacterium CG22_combo_CG10-13_8_21_14_all_33_16]PIV62675.1 MAG: hypothetical protein COS12_01480 [Candidatus Roizmanbacteria bacterium CG01_land_8_20_14_3_00_33_9]PIX70275.1 MAG: hypothetical protein COZ39_04700 [Candidatus Roizmanbacteria bacterium CG_4_10_14_